MNIVIVFTRATVLYGAFTGRITIFFSSLALPPFLLFSSYGHFA